MEKFRYTKLEDEILINFKFYHVGWEGYTKVPPEAAKQGLLYKPYLKNALDNNIPLGHFLGLLGMPGMTAHLGLTMIGKPKQGETIFISVSF